jgi:hypothetical protein
MNWELFYSLNSAALNMLGLGFMYSIMIGVILFSAKLFLDTLNEEDVR